ncbi:MAG: hypothetical protein ACRENF_01660, partial [Thermodesulfobacteriota bacterium]
LKTEINRYVLFLMTLIFSLHTVFVWQTLWIAQRNELLMLLFYISACYMVLLYLLYHRNYFLWLFLACYVLSVSAKQQSLHLPVIILLIAVFFKSYFSETERKNLFRFSLAMPPCTR